MIGEWTTVRVRGERGFPSLDGAGFLSCIASIRREMAGARWHYRWVPDPAGFASDGLRVEFRHGSAEMKQVLHALESRVPPPDALYDEPLCRETDLDDVQTEEEMEFCLGMLWRYSEFLADLRGRNPSLTASGIRDLTPGAFLTFVTGDRRHLEGAMDEQRVRNVPAVAFGKVIGLIRDAGLRYVAPPDSRDDACAAARIHHLTGCTFASRYYPFRRSV